MTCQRSAGRENEIWDWGHWAGWRSPIDGRLVIAQHARLGSTRFIISRGLKELLNTGDNSFQKSLNALKKYHAKASNFTEEEANHSKHVFYECIESYTKD